MTTDKMLIDAAHPEETRVVVLRGNRIEEFDYESAAKKLLRGNIYLAKITRVEPSLQAAFVDYGGNRHGFLAFSEIHPDYYQIPVADRQALLREEAEAVAEEARRESVDPEPSHDRAHQDEEMEGGEPGATEIEEAGGGSVPWDIDDPAPHVISSGNGEQDVHGAMAAERSDPALRGPMAVSDLLPPNEPMDADAHAGSEPSAMPGELPHDEPFSGPDNHGHAHHHAASASEGTAAEGSSNPESQAEESPERRRRPRRAQYKIQEVIKRRQIILVQVVKEERGNKGAALTTYLSLAGRYTVLMPNTARGGGISRKITNAVDRRRLKEITSELEVPDGMGLIVRTAGASRTTAEIKRDHDYLLRLWESIRDLTLKSSAPALVYEEGSLVKRSIRDLYSKEIDEVVVAGQEAYESARDFMRMLMPSHAKNVKLYDDAEPLFARFQIERQLNAMYSPYVTLKSGGYIVLNQTEALVAIDVNSGRSTREHSIEDTALNTNLEASDEIARQLRLRDLAGLIVIDFIDMDERRNNRSVERRLKDALRFDRARIQVGRISHFGLMEMSRQRLRTGVLEGSTSQCPHCMGTGVIRSTESVALAVLRALEDQLMGHQPRNMVATTSIEAALYLLNEKRAYLRDIEARYGVSIEVDADAQLQGANFRVDATGPAIGVEAPRARHAVQLESGFEPAEEAGVVEVDEDTSPEVASEGSGVEDVGGEEGDRKRPRRRRRRRGDRGDRPERAPIAGQNGGGDYAGNGHAHDEASAGVQEIPVELNDNDADSADDIGDEDGPEAAGGGAEGERGERRGRRRGRRGGRRNRRGGREGNGDPAQAGEAQGEGRNGNDAPRFEAGSPGAEQPEVAGYGWERPAADMPMENAVHAGNGHAPLTSEPLAPAIAPVHDEAASAVGSMFREATPKVGAAPVSTTAPEPAPAVHQPAAAEPQAPAPAAETAPVPVQETVPAHVVPTEPEPTGPPKRGWWNRRFSGN